MGSERGTDESSNDEAVGGKLNALGDRRRRFLLLFISISISIFTLLLLLNLTTSRETFIALGQINPIFLLLAFLIHIFALTIWSLRLKILSDFVSERRNSAKFHPAREYENYNHCNCGGSACISGEAVEEQRRRRWKRQRLKFSDSLKIVFASLFGACITPSQFGGEPIRIYLLNKKGLSVGDSTVVVFGERVFDFFVVMVGAFLGSLFLWHATSSAILKAFCMFFGVVFCLGVVAVTFCVSKPESVCGVFERIFSAIERFAERSSRGRATLKRVRERAFQELENFCAAVVAIREEGRKVILFALFLSAALWTVDFCIPSLILLGLNAPPVWLFSFAAQFLLLVLVALPTTPGSSGVAEIGIASLYANVVGMHILGVFTLLWRLVVYYLNLFIGGITSLFVLGELKACERVRV